MSRARAELKSWSLLMSVLLGHPQEFYDRAAGHADLVAELLFGKSPTYETVSWEGALRYLESLLGHVAHVLDEPALKEVEEGTRRLLEDIRGDDPFSARWAADSLLARCCYLMCRLLKPDVIVETGV